MRKLRIGDRVKTPRGPGVVTSWSENRLGCGDAWRVAGDDGREGWWDGDDLTPLPRDIPREHVADLYLAVMRRCGQLMDGDRSNEDRARHADLAEVAECLRLLLEGEVRDGE